MLDSKLQTEFVQALLSVPATARMGGRDALLGGVPPNVVAGLFREENNHSVDLRRIVSQLDGLGRLAGGGEWPLIIVAENAISMVEGTTVAQTVREVKRELEAHYRQASFAKIEQPVSPASVLGDYSKADSFISNLGQILLDEKEVRDISEKVGASELDFIGLRVTTLSIDFVAFVKADGLSNKEIIKLRDEFFDIAQLLPQQLGIKYLGRKPNGLLGFVFANQCPAKRVKFIKKHSKICHWQKNCPVVVPWTLELATGEVYTHQNPVSGFPPVIIPASQVFPGLDYLSGFVRAYSKSG